MYKKLKTADFFNMQLFIFEIESFNFCICQKTTFAWSDLEQASSGWINSNFCEGKVSIWRCLITLTFSGLHFFYFIWPPWIFNRGLSNPQWTRNGQNASLCTAAVGGLRQAWFGLLKIAPLITSSLRDHLKRTSAKKYMYLFWNTLPRVCKFPLLFMHS